jgi:GNAT superfamily N-acetyltransferase
MLREARPGEAEALAEIQRAASVAALQHIFPADLYPYPIEDVRERWRTVVAGTDFSALVAEVDDRAVGVAAFRDEWLEGLYVHPDHWGQGLGLGLHDRALEQLRERGCARCHLWVLEENHRARGFYERHGWRVNGETRVVPFPPNPLDVGYTIDLDSRMAER